MKFDDLLRAVADEPLFTSGFLLTPGVSPTDVRRQLWRWVRGGKLIRLGRGRYALAPPYRKHSAHPFLLASRLRQPSYVSLQSALAFHGMIPEFVPNVTSATTGRPEIVRTPLGTFVYRHVDKSFFSGYVSVEVDKDQTAFVAVPEKALLDLIHLTPGADAPGFLDELRLQNLDAIDSGTLCRFGDASGKPKLMRAIRHVLRLRSEEQHETL